MSLTMLSAGAAVTPPLPPLPPVAISAMLPTRFGGGVTVTTTQLGTVPSWGPEIGMLTSQADRFATYAAHAQAGAQGIWFSLYTHYQEPSVRYPQGTAAWNDFTGPNVPLAVALADEIRAWAAARGIVFVPLCHLGGDELGSAYLLANGAAILAALAGHVAGVTPTFDSNSDGDWSDPGDNWAAVDQALAAAMPASMFLANWLPAGWARLGTINLGSGQVVAAEAVVGRWCVEGVGTRPSLFLDPWTPVDTSHSLWDPTHLIYQPTWEGDPVGFLSYVQVLGRRVAPGWWTPPPGAFYNAPGGIGQGGGPDDGQPVTISWDERNPKSYTTAGQACSLEEIWTYGWTHGDGVPPTSVDVIRSGGTNMGCSTTG